MKPPPGGPATDDPATAGCPYALGARIGRGGQADVHAAVDPVDGMALAVKVLRPGAGSKARWALVREYQLLRELDLPAFPEAIGFGHLRDGRTWLAMRHVEGVRAHEWARALGSAGSAARCAGVLAMLALAGEAVADLHALGVVHGDLKPSNLLVGPDGTPRIIDLGGASLDLGPDHAGRGFFRTAAYAPAEQLARGPIGPSADVFALAATAVRLLTDRHAFGAGSETPGSRDPRVPAEALASVEGLPEGARALLLSALSLDPAQRPADGKAFAEALRAVVPPTPPSAPVDAPTDALRAWPPAPLDRVLMAAAMAVATPLESVALATLAAGLEAPAAAVRRALDRLDQQGWVHRTHEGLWRLSREALDVALARPDALSETTGLAGRLADEWEGDPVSAGRAHCLLLSERPAAAADVAARWARGMLAQASAGDVARCAAALDALDDLDGALDGPARATWLHLRARVAALAWPSDPRVDAWLGGLVDGPTMEAARATSLRAAIARWRGAPSPSHASLSIAAREWSAGRYEAALGLARSEVQLAIEQGALDVAAEAAWRAGEALTALGRLGEAARALADALAWCPGREGRGLVALARSEALRAMGRWEEAGAVLGRVLREAATEWDAGAATVGLAALATDCGHTVKARRWLASVDPAALGPRSRLAVAHAVETLRATALGGDADLSLARSHDPLVEGLYKDGRRGEAAHVAVWQAAAAWAPDAPAEAGALVDAALATLGEDGHALARLDAMTLRRWLNRAEGRPVGEDDLDAHVEEAGAWPHGMRAALASGDVVTAWQMATRFLAHLDAAQAAAIELAPWAVRARRMLADDGHGVA